VAKLLVTGGAGYVGSICSTIFLEHGHDVVVVDDLSTGFRDAVPEGAAFYEMDIANRAGITDVVLRHSIDAVFHFAAKALIPESIKDPGVFFDRNLASSIALLEAVRHAGVQRFVFSSTAAVYGNPQQIPIPEDHPTQPVNAYGETKLALERALEWYARAYGWTAVAFRYFSAAGALPNRGERHCPETHLLPLVLEAAVGQRPSFSIYGDDYDTPDGTCLRDFVHVRDLAAAHLKALDLSPGSGFHVFNVGSGEMYSVRQICTAVERLTGHSFDIRIAPRRAGDPPLLCASPQRLMRQLNWKPGYSDLDTILRDAWNWTLRGHRTTGAS